MNPTLPADLLNRLASFDSCSIADAMDAAGVRLANEGFCDNRVRCCTPRLHPMVGTVVTLRVRSADPPMKNTFYLEQPDWWERLENGLSPRVLAIEDVDAKPGLGASVGPVHACILKAMGFVGVITNGALRGCGKFDDIGLQAFAGNISPAHAYRHVVEIGGAIEIAGLPMKSGDLLHGDRNGIVKVPSAIAERVAALAEGFRDREKRVCEYCGSASFSKGELRRNIGRDAGPP